MAGVKLQEQLNDPACDDRDNPEDGGGGEGVQRGLTTEMEIRIKGGEGKIIWTRGYLRCREIKKLFVRLLMYNDCHVK